MNFSHNNRLSKTVEAKATNRPLKIAYLVNSHDEDLNNINIDAVFFESYTRWAGMYTLIIPTRVDGFLDDGYEEWIRHYDPDFIYSYVDLDIDFIDRISHLCCPISFLSNGKINKREENINWRSFLPNWGILMEPVSSVSTIKSPTSYSRIQNDDGYHEPIIFTQFGMEPNIRFLADNFGTGLRLHEVTNPIPGLFRTLCLVPPDLPANIFAGTERCLSSFEAFKSISDRKVTPISKLAMVNSSGMPRIESWRWNSAFLLFIGSAPLDRINFWNSRHIGNGWGDIPNALILDLDVFDDENFIVQLGKYLNKNNFIGNGNGPYLVNIYSSSVPVVALNAIKEKLQPHTWNLVGVSKTPDALALPSARELAEGRPSQSSDTITLKLDEETSEIIANEPAHFIYMPPQQSWINRGQWIVELDIQRHNNISKYSNVIDTWKLPQRRRLARIFTARLARPTLGGRLALVPSVRHRNFENQAVKTPSFYDINLPSDEVFFRHLVLEKYFLYPDDDLRKKLPSLGYADLVVSDKGQNLRGVISLFDNLATAFDILTNSFWRSVFVQARVDSTTPLTFDMNKLSSLLPSGREKIRKLTQTVGLGNERKTKEYINDGLLDTLEYLIRLNVFYQVAHWSCKYCGHMNSRSFDNMRIKNECDICKKYYLVPIDMEWKYELNNFVYRSIQKHSGMPVLWSLGFLQNESRSSSFWYLPEVNLYEQEDDLQSQNEIDILGVVGGKFYAVEAKRSVSMFVNKVENIDKFVKVIGLLRPDIAFLAFERYCADDQDADAIKIRLAEVAKIIETQIGPWIKLKVCVAQDMADFDEFSGEFGWSGDRIQKYFQ